MADKKEKQSKEKDNSNARWDCMGIKVLSKPKKKSVKKGK